jgi:hypothetical protein
MPSEQKMITSQIEDVKHQLMQIRDMRPGNLNQQFRKPKEKLGEYYQLNYTFRGKTRTEHVKKENIEIVRGELDEYQKAKDLFLDWMELSIKLSKLRIKGG